MRESSFIPVILEIKPHDIAYIRLYEIDMAGVSM